MRNPPALGTMKLERLGEMPEVEQARKREKKTRERETAGSEVGPSTVKAVNMQMFPMGSVFHTL